MLLISCQPGSRICLPGLPVTIEVLRVDQSLVRVRVIAPAEVPVETHGVTRGPGIVVEHMEPDRGE